MILTSSVNDASFSKNCTTQYASYKDKFTYEIEKGNTI